MSENSSKTAAAASGEPQLDSLSSFASVAGLVASKTVVVHPIVLLSVVDHYNRVARGTSRRVVGTLLGEISDGEIHVTNSFALPFEEDPKDPNVWYLDRNYHEHLYHMFKKVNTRERVLGWYSTGPQVRMTDLEIHEIFRRYTPNPVYVIVDINPKDSVVPTKAYYSFEQPTSDRTFRRTFVHVASTIGALEAEEVGVEHLLRDLKNASTSTLATRVADKLSALKLLIGKIQEIYAYLQDAANKKIVANPNIMYTIQDIFNLLPDLSDPELIEAFTIQANDTMLNLYLGSVVRSVLALHNLINNKVENKRASEEKKEKKEDEETGETKKEAGTDTKKGEKESSQ
ncbi:Mov34/MPN/PAD-1 family protein [Toxoplasma gondii TgCatPRC2]|uniref:26S proteasome regulatory subunit, putative n=15 Tax=Toxoplasma gondii TaxID=5811 RepID=B9PHD3_TOXGV|nr:Mov34/MPN/PAD-1 family protein [Toxoplasma gondii ME49]EPR64908.1 Mov34/MPN/PAD-1 family protein [Toxoplasma gondii GT1]ESS36380.1 Mov34/MPN/PAD-1 family protein [Toxoplasma gondii VEG]KAF4642386.1 Mov34/MPN/PAD-1 family protein [Toxoplasma gondii]KFG43951.1 Mov34/MPN/PAD-1 family protein [Toxoplasma gondii GAB2-2007-GAL-DOM2]KFG52405.1 Mov34/MPN/PAD-1 family protein [Toxoplasma gondii p89]KFG54510.1 Mov34/MPN/PAD-1 family protein [Toxoplasma gondii FOU]KFG61487.1 Mov34/MPN/PAD-1 family p|eukprot:XP_002365616.1 Mov34/MPN/PAD-1 family protein [Toxoplasma gondii ME49]